MNFLDITPESNEKLGRIVGEEVNKWIVQFEEKKLDFIKNKDNLNFACGDWVLFNNGEKLKQIEPFNRLGRLKNEQSQVVAHNVNQMLIVTSINFEFNLSRLERYVAWAKNEEIIPYILLSKIDLSTPDELNEKLTELAHWFPDVSVIPFSVLQKAGMDQLNIILEAKKTSVVVGSSGVGKSTLINILLQEDVQKTFTIGENDKGRHTTTNRKIFLMQNGHYIMDNPGIRSLSFDGGNICADEICRYSNCTHVCEPGCGLLEKLHNGLISKQQYLQKMKLIREMKRHQIKDSVSMQQEQSKKYRTQSKERRSIQGSKAHYN